MRARRYHSNMRHPLGRMAMDVADVMTRSVISIAPDDLMRKAAQLMLQYDVSGFPVLDRGELVGIITEGDFLRRGETSTERHRTRWIELLAGSGRLAEEYAHAHGRKVGEVMTRDVVTIAEALNRQPWAPHGSVDVVVENGVVGLLGVILDERQRDALRIAAENIPGVKEVHDHLLELDRGAVE